MRQTSRSLFCTGFNVSCAAAHRRKKVLNAVPSSYGGQAPTFLTYPYSLSFWLSSKVDMAGTRQTAPSREQKKAARGNKPGTLTLAPCLLPLALIWAQAPSSRTNSLCSCSRELPQEEDAFTS